MVRLDLLLSDACPALVRMGLAQAATPYLVGAWRREEGVDVLPCRVHEETWLSLPMSWATVDLGFSGGTIAVRLPAALAMLARSRLPVRSTRSEGTAVVLELDLREGMTWESPWGVGVRWAEPEMLVG
jgi:hypothetical protein